MRDILNKATMGAMIAGAALIVAACGTDTTTDNVATTNLGEDPMLNDMGDLNAMDDTMMTNDLDAALDNAAAATDNAAEAIANAQDAAGQ